jgi:hypothetical protein
VNEDIKSLLGRALTPEPPLRLDRDDLIRRGRVRARIRRIALSAAVAASVVTVVAGAVVISRFGAGGAGGEAGSSHSAGRGPVTVTEGPMSGNVTWPPTTEGRAADLTKVLTEAKVVPPRFKVVDATRGAPQVLTFRPDMGHYTLTADLVDAEGRGNLTITVGYHALDRPPPDCARDMPGWTNCQAVDESGLLLLQNIEKGTEGFTAYGVVAARPDRTALFLEATNSPGGRNPVRKPAARSMPPVDLSVLRAIATLPGLSFY